jgi:hypothetical protein
MIYICYGMTKSASTLLYQLTEELLRVAGRKPVRLKAPFKPIVSVENYFDTIDPPLLQDIEARHPGRDVVLKTHQAPHPQIAARVRDGDILASASIRDPREIALSMIDHGERSRHWGYEQFSECRAPQDALPSLDNQIATFRAWAALPPVIVFRYNEICFETKAVASRVAEQLGVAADVDAALKPFADTKTIGQFNKGVALRWREMPPAQQELFLARYADFYRDYAFETPAAARLARNGDAAPGRGQLGQYLAHMRRLFRV